MLVKIIVGQIWTDGFERYEITRISIIGQPYAKCLGDENAAVRFPEAHVKHAALRDVSAPSGNRRG